MARVRRYDSPIPAHQAAEFLRSRGIPDEVVALKAGGIAPQRVCLPIISAAMVISLFTLLLN